MPRISYFYGISIYMYRDDHNWPHIHVRYAGQEASLEISNPQRYQGKLPKRILRIVLEWIALHEDELINNWQIAETTQELNQIAPLD